MSATRKLTPKQAAFVEEHAIDLNATQAAIRAGYSAKTAKEQATRLLSNVHVAAAIAEGRAARSERTGIKAERILAELARVAFFDIRKLLNPDGTMKPLDELDDDTAAAIAGIDLAEIRDGEGSPIGVLKKIKIADKRKRCLRPIADVLAGLIATRCRNGLQIVGAALCNALEQ
jgi:phage terminase small subunit